MVVELLVIQSMRDLHIKMLPGSDALLFEHSREMPQKNELCGAFWITLALRSLAAENVEQDNVGHAAGSILSVIQTRDSLPPGDTGRDDYILELPRIEDSNLAGTSPQGLVVAIDHLASGKLVGVPISGKWSADSIDQMLNALSEMNQPVLLIANSATRFLWGGKTDPITVLEFLCGNSVSGPPPDWDVGHYIGIMGWIQRGDRKLAICADTYRSLGWEGIHVQPFEQIADSLRRDDSEFSGGAFIVTKSSLDDDIRALVASLNLSCELWDNGTPYIPNRP